MPRRQTFANKLVNFYIQNCVFFRTTIECWSTGQRLICVVMMKAVYCRPGVLAARSELGDQLGLGQTFEVESLRSRLPWVLPLTGSSGPADLTLRTINYLQPHMLKTCSYIEKTHRAVIFCFFYYQGPRALTMLSSFSSSFCGHK